MNILKKLFKKKESTGFRPREIGLKIVLKDKNYFFHKLVVRTPEEHTKEKAEYYKILEELYKDLTRGQPFVDTRMGIILRSENFDNACIYDSVFEGDEE